ncbi:pyruvate:ferredoxin (flavodoxin) oxidoreductase, partial [Gordonibacter pamelaeae]|uniref:pyruvate:ferredoxin (flavodoxin) oxidoreductase n=1 Tax=Gordonibacter pamelaeae TaxID=471189 RepID=UPI002666B8A9
MTREFKSMDGNNAAAYVSYAFTEVAGIYPITPSSPMADLVDQWSAAGQKNIFGTKVKVCEMQSEGGAAGAVHGSLAAGALTTTYTASQGLLLMIPNMYKMAAEQLPCVFHVSARTVATQALSIFGDHSDVMACRQTGFAMLAETNVQEVMDLSAVAHLAAIKGRVPFINFFDGFRTSHEVQKISVWDYDDLAEMCDMDAVRAFREHALNPEHPAMRGSHENGDVFFQHREACNGIYDALPAVVEDYMHQVNTKLGTNYELFNYYGAPDADRVIVAMGSFCDVVEEVVDYLNAHGEKVGLVKVRLYRPFVSEKFMAALPATCKKIAVMDRTKEPGALGEPLYMDVVNALAHEGRGDLTVVGGRYGLASKDTPPSSVFAVYKELEKDAPAREFTVGIVDDVTNLSLPEDPASPNTAAAGTVECKFWGLGGDGTVGANKNSIKIIGDHTDKYVQAYFQYDSKKTGGVTISHLRFGDSPIRSTYYVNKADFVACHNPSYVTKGFRMVNDVKPGGTFMINCQWTPEELEHHLNAEAKRYIANNGIKLYTINAIDLAREIGMGKRTNTILQSAFFTLANVIPQDEAIQYMKDAATKSYMKKGQDVVDMNHRAIDAGATAFVQVEVPASWAEAVDEGEAPALEGRAEVVKMVREIMEPVGRMDGDRLPVSAFVPHVDGQFEQGAAAYEKRGVAVSVPAWDAATCIQCNQCAFVCPHATIRPFALTEAEAAAAPAATTLVPAKGKAAAGLQYTLAISPLDCMGCSVCVNVCPSDSLSMVPQEDELAQQDVFDYCVEHVSGKPELEDASVKGSQFKQPLLEFSGACAGCAETAYAKLVTQLFGDRMYITNATGCSSIWGGPAATSPYAVNKDGRGPAWSNSLFEDNAEHGLGMLLGHEAVRDKLVADTEALLATDAGEDVLAAAQAWLDARGEAEGSKLAADAYVAELEKLVPGNELAAAILENKDYLAKKSVWIFGGDGWAYDIGYGGLDHVLASGEDVNVFVFDTEVYSNTGGQASKASNIGQVAQFAAAGKDIKKKSLTEIAMSYGYVYVAQVAMGAKPAQTIKAIAEAEAYPGPSLIIGYSPCEMHSIKGGMANCQDEMKKAVDCGYWNLFRFNPAAPEGKKFTLDSKEPAGGYQDFLMNEARYSRLTREFPER